MSRHLPFDWVLIYSKSQFYGKGIRRENRKEILPELRDEIKEDVFELVIVESVANSFTINNQSE